MLGVIASPTYAYQWTYYEDGSYLQYSKWDPSNRPAYDSPTCSVVARVGNDWLMQPSQCDVTHGSVCQFPKRECRSVNIVLGVSVQHVSRRDFPV